MKELFEEILNHCDSIIETSQKTTSGNYAQQCFKSFLCKDDKTVCRVDKKGIKFNRG